MKFSKIPLSNFSIWKKINRTMSSESKILYMYLFSSSLTSMSGIFEIPDFRKTGLDDDIIESSLKELEDNSLITIDEDNEMIAVFEMIKINRPAGIKQETGIIKKYQEVEDFSKWSDVLSYMIEIDYTESIISFIKENKISNKPKVKLPSHSKEVSKLTEEEKKEEVSLIKNEILSKKEEKYKIAYVDAIEILDYYQEKSDRTTKDGDLTYVYERINELIKKHDVSYIKTSIDRYLENLDDLKYSQGTINVFNQKTSNLVSFLKNPKKGIKIKKNSITGSKSDYDKATKLNEQINSNLPEELYSINSLAINTIYSKKLNDEFKEFIRERSNWKFKDEDFLTILSSRIMQADNMAEKFLKVKGISI